MCVCAVFVIVYKINNENGKQWSIELGLHCELGDKKRSRDRVGETANQSKQLSQLWPKKQKSRLCFDCGLDVVELFLLFLLLFVNVLCT